VASLCHQSVCFKPRLTNSKPALLQLAGKNGKSLLFPLKHLSKPTLKNLAVFVSDPRHIFAGSRIKGDITRIKSHYECFSECEIDSFDVGQEAVTRGVLAKGVSRSLRACVANFLERKLVS
jgi:hypothetical protein